MLNLDGLTVILVDYVIEEALLGLDWVQGRHSHVSVDGLHGCSQHARGSLFDLINFLHVGYLRIRAYYLLVLLLTHLKNRRVNLRNYLNIALVTHLLINTLHSIHLLFFCQLSTQWLQLLPLVCNLYFQILLEQVALGQGLRGLEHLVLGEGEPV